MSDKQDQADQLPEGWAWVTIGETGEYINGFAFKPGHRESSGLPIVRIQNLTDESKPLNTTNLEVHPDYKIDSGDMLMSWSATLDVFVWKRGPALVNQHIFKVVPDERVMSKELLFFWLKQAIQELQKTDHLHGSTMMHINRGPFMAHQVPLPPYAEQTRIVARLEELLTDLDRGVAELKAAQKKLPQNRQSLLKAAVEGALTSEWRAKNPPAETGAQLLQRSLHERRARWEAKQLAKFKEQGKAPSKDWQKKYPEPVQPGTADFPELPEGWVWASVEQVSSDERYSLSIGPFGSNLKVPDYQETGVPLVFVRNIRSGNYGGAFTKYVTPEKANELSAHSISAGDVLVTKMGEPPGDADVYPSDQPSAVITADCIKVRCWPGLMAPQFLKAVINSHIGKRQIEPMTQGVAQKKVSLGRFTSLAVPVPPADEQAVIVKTVEVAEREALEQLVAINLSVKQTTAQRQNILRSAFAGQLVPQDSKDEPARLLLERNRAERAEREKQPKVRKTKQQKEIAAVVSKLIDVLAEAGDWVPAQEAFRRCGVADGAETDQIEELYAELRDLDKSGRLAVESVTDEQGRKLHDRLKLLAG